MLRSSDGFKLQARLVRFYKDDCLYTEKH